LKGIWGVSQSLLHVIILKNAKHLEEYRAGVSLRAGHRGKSTAHSNWFDHLEESFLVKEFR